MADEPMDRWFKSSFSDAGECVEVRRVAGGMQVRDSKDPAGAMLTFTRAEWKAFLSGVRHGEFELGECELGDR